MSAGTTGQVMGGQGRCVQKCSAYRVCRGRMNSDRARHRLPGAASARLLPCMQGRRAEAQQMSGTGHRQPLLWQAW